MIPRLDLAQEIRPAGGLGGFEVGSPLTDYRELLRHGVLFDRVTPRVHGLWQIVYRISQIYDETAEESERHDQAFKDWKRWRKAGEEADLTPIVDIVRPPDDPPAIDLWVDVRDGLVDAVTALGGYQSGFRSVRVGMSFGEARVVEPGLVRTSAFLDEIAIEASDGIVLWFEPADPDPDQEDAATLEGITVFDPARSWGGIKPF
jgi:hypothetical protein